MAEPALKRMTVDDFLRWEDGTDTRYELIDGVPVAMAPAAEAHGMLAARLSGRIDARVATKRPCRAVVEPGISRWEGGDTFFVADLAMTCAPYDPRRQYVQDPLLIVEILSPSTMGFDRNVKVPEYRRIPSVQEILLLDSERAFAEVLRREGERWITEIVQGIAATLSLASVPLSVAMAELYDGVLPAEAPEPGAAAATR